MIWLPFIFGGAGLIGLFALARRSRTREEHPVIPEPKPAPILPVKPTTPDEPSPVMPIDPVPVVPGFPPWLPVTPQPVPDVPEADQFGPDNPSPTPKPGRFYQVKSGDTLSKLCAQAYGDGTVWRKVRDAAENDWIPVHPTAGLTLNPKYRDPRFQVPYGSGNKFPLVFFPVLS